MKPDGRDRKCKNGMAALSQMRREHKNTDPAAYGGGGFSAGLSEMQTCLCDLVPGGKMQEVKMPDIRSHRMISMKKHCLQ